MQGVLGKYAGGTRQGSRQCSFEYAGRTIVTHGVLQSDPNSNLGS